MAERRARPALLDLLTPTSRAERPSSRWRRRRARPPPLGRRREDSPWSMPASLRSLYSPKQDGAGCHTSPLCDGSGSLAQGRNENDLIDSQHEHVQRDSSRSDRAAGHQQAHRLRDPRPALAAVETQKERSGTERDGLPVVRAADAHQERLCEPPGWHPASARLSPPTKPEVASVCPEPTHGSFGAKVYFAGICGGGAPIAIAISS